MQHGAGALQAQQMQRGLRALRAEGAGSAGTPSRALLLPDAPSRAAGEVTDKGYLNQRLVLGRRAAEVAALYATPADSCVITA